MRTSAMTRIPSPPPGPHTRDVAPSDGQLASGIWPLLPPQPPDVETKDGTVTSVEVKPPFRGSDSSWHRVPWAMPGLRLKRPVGVPSPCRVDPLRSQAPPLNPENSKLGTPTGSPRIACVFLDFADAQRRQWLPITGKSNPSQARGRRRGRRTPAVPTTTHPRFSVARMPPA